MNPLFIKLTLILSMVSFFLACSPTNPRREAPSESPRQVELGANPNTEVEVNSQLDILFVIDDSNSMGKHQINVSKYISAFTKTFAKKTLVDFHIGITKAFDAEIQMRKTEGRTKRQVNIWPSGQLLPLKAPKGLEASIKNQPNYITKSTPNYLKVLEASLKVCDTPQCPPDGPVYEEFFGPVSEAFSPQALQGANAGFYRPGAHLAIIFITDAEDSTKGVSANDIFEELKALKGGNTKLLSAHGVLAPSFDPNCLRDNAGLPPTKIEALLGYFNNTPVSLCTKNFEKDLGGIGLNLAQRIDRTIIPLSFEPDYRFEKPFRIYYGLPGGKQQEINQDSETGWTYIPPDAGGPAIALAEKLAVEYQDGAKLRIEAVEVDLSNQTNGRVKPL
jgi:hypothetical protein